MGSAPCPGLHRQWGLGGEGDGPLRGHYLTASLLQLDFDQEDEADQGDHDEESQENPHIEVFSGLLEQNTDTVSHSALRPGDGHVGWVGSGQWKDGATGLRLRASAGPTGASADRRTVRSPGPGNAPQRPAGVSARPPNSWENSERNSAESAVTGRRGPSE